MKNLFLLLFTCFLIDAHAVDAWEIIQLKNSENEAFDLRHVAIAGNRSVYVAGLFASDGIIHWDDGEITTYYPSEGQLVTDLVYADQTLWALIGGKVYTLDGSSFSSTGFEAERLFAFEGLGVWIVNDYELQQWNGSSFVSLLSDNKGIDQLLVVSDDELWYTNGGAINPSDKLVHLKNGIATRYTATDMSPDDNRQVILGPRLLKMGDGIFVTANVGRSTYFDGTNWTTYPFVYNYNSSQVLEAASSGGDAAWTILNSQRSFDEGNALQRFDLDSNSAIHNPLLEKVKWNGIDMNEDQVFVIGNDGMMMIGDDAIQPMTTSAYLDANDFFATFQANGSHHRYDKEDYLFNFTLGEDSVPVMFELSPLIAAKNQAGELRASGGRYRTDFVPGPTSDGFIYRSSIVKLSKVLIDRHKRSYNAPGYVMPEAIKNWPANGLAPNGEPVDLARFHDVNNNGFYDPENGDYPIIRGDQAIIFLSNDQHSNMRLSGGEPTGIDIIGMAYVFNDPVSEVLNQSIFFHYELVNRSGHFIDSARFGLFMDLQVGNSSDDYFGCSQEHDIAYAYNGTNFDHSPTVYNGFGQNPPAIGMKFLGDGLDAFINPFSSGNFNPQSGDITIDSDIWNFLHARWRDGSSLAYGGTGYDPMSSNQTRYMFDGDPITNSGWTPLSAGISPSGSTRPIGSFPGFAMDVNERISFDFVLGAGRSVTGNNLTKIQALFDNMTELEVFFDEQNFEEGVVATKRAPWAPLGQSNNSLSAPQLMVYPNPSNGVFQIEGIQLEDRVSIYNQLGQQVHFQRSGQHISLNEPAPGHYFISVQPASGSAKNVKINVQ